jgi:hypothetical protein
MPKNDLVIENTPEEEPEASPLSPKDFRARIFPRID